MPHFVLIALSTAGLNNYVLARLLNVCLPPQAIGPMNVVTVSVLVTSVFAVPSP